MPPLIHHKRYSAGLCTQIPTLPTVRPSLPISRVVGEKHRNPQSTSYTWPKSDKISRVFDDAKDISHHPNRYFNQNSDKLKNEDLMLRRREACSLPEFDTFKCSVSTSGIPTLNPLANSSNEPKNMPSSTVSWNPNEPVSPGCSLKRPPGPWNPLKGNDKEMWESRMKENAELLRLYKYGFPGLNQTRVPDTSPSNPGMYSEQLGAGKQRMRSDKIYLNIDPVKDIIDYEPLSKSIPNSRLPQSHATSRNMNGSKGRPGIMLSPDKPFRKASFSTASLPGETNDYNNGTGYWSPFEAPNSPRMKAWEQGRLSTLSKRVGSFQNGPIKSAFARPEIRKTLTSTIADLQKLQTPPRDSSGHVPNPIEVYVGDLPKGNNLSLVNPTNDNNNKTKKIIRDFEKKTNNNNNSTGYASAPFRSHIKRSLAIYLGVDPEIDTVQYQPLNKSLTKLHARHVFSSQYCKMQELGRREDRDARVLSKKKSVYSCGYDVNSINVMLQNAKKRFKCWESSSS